jgi:hypothetical protein
MQGGGLAEALKELAPQMIALGVTKRSALGAELLGTTIERVIHEAPAGGGRPAWTPTLIALSEEQLDEALRLVGGSDIRRLLSKPQRAFYEAHAPDGVELDDLEALGPVNVLKLKFSPKDLRRRMVAELWVYPDFSRILELSAKCLPGEGMRAAAEAKAHLSKHGVDLSADQQTKTRTALEDFAQQLVAPDAMSRA